MLRSPARGTEPELAAAAMPACCLKHLNQGPYTARHWLLLVLQGWVPFPTIASSVLQGWAHFLQVSQAEE